MGMKKILVVDDEESYTRLLKLTLEDTGQYEVRIENIAKRAVDAARYFMPDVIILDVIMPDMSGLEVATQVRKNPQLAERPIIFLTAAVSKDRPDMQHELLDRCPVVAKPVSADELIEIIEKTLAGKK